MPQHSPVSPSRACSVCPMALPLLYLKPWSSSPTLPPFLLIPSVWHRPCTPTLAVAPLSLPLYLFLTTGRESSIWLFSAENCDQEEADILEDLVNESSDSWGRHCHRIHGLKQSDGHFNAKGWTTPDWWQGHWTGIQPGRSQELCRSSLHK